MKTQHRSQRILTILSHLQTLNIGEGYFAIDTRDPNYGASTRIGLLTAAGTEVFETGISPAAPEAQPWVLALPYEPESTALIGRVIASVLLPHSGESPVVNGDPTSPAFAALQTVLDHELQETPPHEQVHATLSWRDNEQAYLRSVESLTAQSAYGQHEVVCLTNQARVEVHDEHGDPRDIDPVVVYTRLRRESPSPYLSLIKLNGRALVSASPELFLRVQDGEVYSQPMKGTRPRGANPEIDRQQREALTSSVKELTENAAVTSALVQEFEHVCAPGTVHVAQQHRLLTFPQVHQLVSDVQGTLNASVTLGELLSAVFPAASMTGVPKAAAMRQIAELEAGPRGLYSGCHGWVGADGGVELAMSIRCAEIVGNTATVGAGGGITAGSVPHEEVAEVLLKARPVLEAIAPGVTSQ